MHMKIEILLANDCGDSGREDADADTDAKADADADQLSLGNGWLVAFLLFLCLRSGRWKLNIQ